MNKTMLATGVALAMGAGAANAAFFQAGSTGTISFTAGCFTFGQCSLGSANEIPDNSLTANGVGSGIGGDGLVGVLSFSTTDGNNLNITSFSQDTYTGTAGGNFALAAPGGTGSMSAFISDSGDVSLDLTGRVGNAAFFAYLGTPAWNIDNSTAIAAQGDATTGTQQLLTSGSQSAWTPGMAATPTLTQTGSALSSTGAGTWTGQIISSGNIGTAWGGFDSTPYTELFNVTVNGVADSGGTTTPPIPVPAAVWLFGSGLVGLVGVARRRKRS